MSQRGFGQVQLLDTPRDAQLPSKRILVKSRQMPDTFFLARATDPITGQLSCEPGRVTGALFACLIDVGDYLQSKAFGHELTLSGWDLGLAAQGG